MKRKVKSLVLGILIIGSIYQIIALWFDNVSDRNFFYSFVESATERMKDPEQGQKDKHMIEPRQFGVFLNASDKDFTVLGKTHPKYEDLFDLSIEAITTILKKGDLIQYEEDDLLWQDRGIVFILNFPLNRVDLASDLGVSQSLFEDLSFVKSIGVIPAHENTDTMKIYFIDDKSKDIYMYTLPKKALEETNKGLNLAISQIEGKDMAAYLSTFKADYEMFRSHVLLPLQTENINYDDGVMIQKPFISGLEIDKDALKGFVNSFFSNPDVAYDLENEEGMTYGDDSAVVKYNRSGVFVYSSLSNKKNIRVSVSTAFNIAEKFIKRDSELSNGQYYLKDYKVIGDNITFYYDYGYKDIPVQLKSSWSEDDLDQYPMQITVANGIVKQYERILMKWSEQETAQVNEIRLEDALNAFLENKDVSYKKIEDMYLSYVRVGDILQLMWIIKYDGVYYPVDL